MCMQVGKRLYSSGRGRQHSQGPMPPALTRSIHFIYGSVAHPARPRRSQLGASSPPFPACRPPGRAPAGSDGPLRSARPDLPARSRCACAACKLAKGATTDARAFPAVAAATTTCAWVAHAHLRPANAFLQAQARREHQRLAHGGACGVDVLVGSKGRGGRQKEACLGRVLGGMVV